MCSLLVYFDVFKHLISNAIFQMGLKSENIFFVILTKIGWLENNNYNPSIPDGILIHFVVVCIFNNVVVVVVV